MSSQLNPLRYSGLVRTALLLCLLCTVAAAQQTPGLTQFLSLTPAQASSITQLNLTYYQFLQTKLARENTVRAEIATENAKASPSALALGQRYTEIDSIDREITAAAADLQAKISTLLTAAQKALLQQISDGLNLQSLNYDAGCGYLEQATEFAHVPTLASRAGDFSNLSDPATGNAFASFLLGYSVTLPCPAAYPISIRTYFALTDSQVSAILALESAYATFKTRKDNRTNDVEVEIRDETAKPQPDPLALGVRYAELIEISQELKQADLDGRAAARNLLTPPQQAKLKSLMDTTALFIYQYPAASCHLLALPNYERTQCQLN